MICQTLSSIMKLSKGLTKQNTWGSTSAKALIGESSLRKLKNILPQRKLDQVYKALFERHLRYGNIVWSALSNTKLSKLQRLQTRAKRLIANAKFKDRWTCKWLTVKSLTSFDQRVMTYRILHVPKIFAISSLKDP